MCSLWFPNIGKAAGSAEVVLEISRLLREARRVLAVLALYIAHHAVARGTVLIKSIWTDLEIRGIMVKRLLPLYKGNDNNERHYSVFDFFYFRFSSTYLPLRTARIQAAEGNIASIK